MAEQDASRDAIERLIERLDHLERVLQSNTQRLHAIERRLNLDSPPPRIHAGQRRPLYESIVDERDESALPPASPRIESPPTTEVRDERSKPETGRTPAPERERQTSPHASPPPPRASHDETTGAGAGGNQFGGATRQEEPPPAPPARRDLENIIGGSWFNWIGIIAFTFGVAFFLKYAFENEWIGPAGRVTLGAAAGLSILFFADRLRARGLRQYAYVLSGGGILILYLSIYAAFNFYRLVEQPVAFVLMALVTMVAVLLSVRHDALAIAILGLIGGFLTPLLLSTGRDNQIGLFTYVALLDAGVLALAYFKRWRSLDFMSFACTTLMFFGWHFAHYRQEKLWPTIFFLTLFFLLFTSLAVAHNVLPRRRTRWPDLLLVICSATLYFGASYTLLDEAGYGRGLGAYALTVSGFYGLLFLAAWTRNRQDRLLVYGYAGAGVTFLTMAVAIQTDQHWVTIGWAAEGLMLTWVGLRAKESAARHAALMVFAVAVGHWFAWDVRDFAFREGAAEFVPLLNRRALSCAALVGALLGSAWAYRRENENEVEAGERSVIGSFFAMMGALMAFTLLTLDVNDYFNARLVRVAPENWADGRFVENTRQFSLTTLWTFYGAALVALGLARRMRLLRFGALLLLAATVLKIFLFDSRYYAAEWHVPVFNQSFMAWALVALSVFAVAFLYRRAGARAVGEEERAVVVPALLLTANLVALGGLSLEAVGIFERAAARLVVGDSPANPSPWARLENSKALALTVVWALYAAALHWLGVRRNLKALRYGALVLLVLVAVKLLAWDVSFYDLLWPAPLFNLTFASFALTIAVLWSVYRNYRRSPEIFDEELKIVPAATVAAHVLAVVALSAEAVGYFATRAGAVDALALRDVRLAQQLALSLVWAVYGGGLLLFGYLKINRLLRVLGLLLLSLTTLKVFFLDLSALDRIYRIISFIVLGAILLAVSYLYQKNLRRASGGQQAADEEKTVADEAT